MERKILKEKNNPKIKSRAKSRAKLDLLLLSWMMKSRDLFEDSKDPFVLLLTASNPISDPIF